MGESGIGKSEAAAELLKRGHRLIADDAVEIRKVAGNTLRGTSPELIRNYIEIRGIGVINVAKLFGMAAIKDESADGPGREHRPWIGNEQIYRPPWPRGAVHGPAGREGPGHYDPRHAPAATWPSFWRSPP